MSKLLDAIAEYQQAFKQKIPDDIQQVMLKATDDLKNTNLTARSLKQGDKAEGFTLPNATNASVSLDTLLEKNDFVVVDFYRGVWCPYCNLELKALENINGELGELNASLVAISPQSPDSSLSTKEKNELSFEVLSDSQNRVAKQYGLVFSLAEELRPIYASFGIDIVGLNDDESYELPMPATYVINKNKEIIFSFMDEDYTKRSAPEEILKAIRDNV